LRQADLRRELMEHIPMSSIVDRSREREAAQQF
jgi:hypothetical protein